ncbi:anthranilate phosphoribosyltransferase [Lachnospiraceae bacterium MD1]|uniref:Anthranilate phosphoribosyltransferase n=1 Tax=Variimorphobacter saccharofermentans TaxID=2755051 RepID=A0A839K187_9FIRM|nr:anthranilate phosphoribosyltransferase [Variimorphobacter saccharofermentans]MBB2183187.1 anthranilate phosphoribosyltransferase [Variimorphobacter saccharofermentans]
MIQEAIRNLLNKEDLSFEMAKTVMDEIMSGNATNAQIASFITAIRMKGETIDEITACARSMRNIGLKLQHEGDVLDIVGTGGDEAFTFNISTISSLVISAAGIPVAKHGNRSVSSKCGSADVLEALGVKIDIPVEKSERILKEIGICFLFAPLYHSSMKYAAPVRKELGVRTIFNILGPLASPANANLQLLGVYDEALVEPMARVLANLGVKRAMVVHGHDGLDEVSLSARTTVCEVNNGKVNSFFLDPHQFGFEYCKPEDLVGGDPVHNADIARRILNGEKGPKRDIVLLNSAVCLYMSYNNITLRECVRMAADTIDSGKAMEQLNRFITKSNE